MKLGYLNANSVYEVRVLIFISNSLLFIFQNIYIVSLKTRLAMRSFQFQF